MTAPREKPVGDWHMVTCDTCGLLVGWTRQPLPRPFYCIVHFDDVAHIPDDAKHDYPSMYGPGSHWSTNEAWEILDALPIGQLTDDQRYLVAGQIAGKLQKAAAEGKPK